MMVFLNCGLVRIYQLSVYPLIRKQKEYLRISKVLAWFQCWNYFLEILDIIQVDFFPIEIQILRPIFSKTESFLMPI